MNGRPLMGNSHRRGRGSWGSGLSRQNVLAAIVGAPLVNHLVDSDAARCGVTSCVTVRTPAGTRKTSGCFHRLCFLTSFFVGFFVLRTLPFLSKLIVNHCELLNETISIPSKTKLQSNIKLISKHLTVCYCLYRYFK